MEQVFGEEVNRFLKALHTDSTRHVYMPSLSRFQEYLLTQTLHPEIRSTQDFLRALLKEKAALETGSVDVLDQSFMDREMMTGFVTYMLKDLGLTAKTVRTYAGAVCSLAAYWKVPIQMEYVELPPAVEANEKYPWSIDKVGTFIKSMESPFYRCLSTWYVQTGLSNYDLLHMQYGKVKEQFETGVTPICLNLVRYKTRRFEVKFRTFVGELGVRFLREYLQSLEKPLAPEDLIFKISDCAVDEYFVRKAKAFLPEEYSGRNPCCPSSLRTAFRTFLTDAECAESIIEYWMGHNLTGDVKKKYTNKSDDSWRQTYKKYEPTLTFTA